MSERCTRAAGKLLERFLSRRLDEVEVLVVFVDAIFLGSHAMLAALGVDWEGKKHALGLRKGHRGRRRVPGPAGGPARSGTRHEAGRERLPGDRGGGPVGVRGGGAVQRCLVHKRRNILEHVPEQLPVLVGALLAYVQRLKEAQAG